MQDTRKRFIENYMLKILKNNRQKRNSGNWSKPLASHGSWTSYFVWPLNAYDSRVTYKCFVNETCSCCTDIKLVSLIRLLLYIAVNYLEFIVIFCILCYVSIVIKVLTVFLKSLFIWSNIKKKPDRLNSDFETKKWTFRLRNVLRPVIFSGGKFK